MSNALTDMESLALCRCNAGCVCAEIEEARERKKAQREDRQQEREREEARQREAAERMLTQGDNVSRAQAAARRRLPLHLVQVLLRYARRHLQPRQLRFGHVSGIDLFDQIAGLKSSTIRKYSSNGFGWLREFERLSPIQAGSDLPQLCWASSRRHAGQAHLLELLSVRRTSLQMLSVEELRELVHTEGFGSVIGGLEQMQPESLRKELATLVSGAYKRAFPFVCETTELWIVHFVLLQTISSSMFQV